ncbi:degenerin unc-8 [Aphelenchoides avenae]|nr:degenerin unc-8 [Aphelenchus avenae]
MSNASTVTGGSKTNTSATTVGPGKATTRHPPARPTGAISTNKTAINGTVTTKSSNATNGFPGPSDNYGATSTTRNTGARGTVAVGSGSDSSDGATLPLTVANIITDKGRSTSATQVPQTDSNGNAITKSDNGATPPSGVTGREGSATESYSGGTDDGSESSDATAVTDGSGHGTSATDDRSGLTLENGDFSGRTGMPVDSSDHTRDPGHPLPSYPPGWAGPTVDPNADKDRSDSTDDCYGSNSTGGPGESGGNGPTKFPRGGSSNNTSSLTDGSGSKPPNNRPPPGWTALTEDPNKPFPTESNGYPIPNPNAGNDRSDTTDDGYGSSGTGDPVGSGGSDPTKLPLGSNVSLATSVSRLTPPGGQPTDSNGRTITPPSNAQLGGSTGLQDGSGETGASNGPGSDGRSTHGSDDHGRSGAPKSNHGSLDSGMTTRPSKKTESTTITISQALLGFYQPSGGSKVPGSGSATNSPGGSDGLGTSDDSNAGQSTLSGDGSGGSSLNGATVGSGGQNRNGSGAPVVTTPRTLGTVIPTEYPLVPINKTYSDAEIEKLIDYYALDRNASQISLEAQVQDRMLEVMRNIDPAVRQQIGYQLRGLIIACSYDGEACDYDNDFEYVSDPDFGNCYTYNFNGIHPIVGSGTNHGLRMIAFSNVSEYLYTSSKAGMRVTLHKQNYAAFPNMEGYNVGIGTYTAIAVQYNDIKRLSHPYGTCTPEDYTEGMIYGGRYTYEGCFRSCFQNDIIARCGCADSRFPLPLNNSSVEYCGPANKQAFLCYQKYLLVKGDYNAVEDCNCTTGCDENAVWIDISYDSSTYEYTNERPVMDGMDLFHNLSGAVCLWLGISMVALMEIVELLSYICLSSGFSPKKSPSVADMNGLGGADCFSPYTVDEADIYGPPPTYHPPDSSSFAYVDAATGPSAYVSDENAPRSARLVSVKFCSD